MMNSRQDRPLQSSSLSTYIGYITGPRAEQPVGVRVVEPPPGTRQHQRGSLYAVIEVVGDHPDRAAIIERLLNEVQRVYYSAKGSQSQVMVEAVQQTQQLLREINAHTPHYPMQLGITCAALLGGKLLVAASGPAFALMRVSERVHMFPSEPNMAAAGYGNIPIEVYRQDVQPDDVFFLGGGGWLRRVPARTLAGIVAFTNAENCTDAADELYDQAGGMQVPGLLIVLGMAAGGEPPRPSGYGGYGGSGSGYPGAPSGGSGSSGGPLRSQAPRRPRFGGLPTALGSAPPARPVPGTPLVPEQPSAMPPPALSPSQTAFGSVAQRTSRPEWEQPLSESVTARSTPVMEPPPTLPQASPETQAETPESRVSELANQSTVEPATETADEPIVETPTAQSQSIQYVDDKTVDDVSVPNAATTDPPKHEAVVEEQPRYPYPISPLEEASFGGDLPVEPGDDVDPIFPPAGANERVERPARQPSWLELWQAQASKRMGQARAFLGRLKPERRIEEPNREWEELSEEYVPPAKPSRPRFNELASQQVAAPAHQSQVHQSQTVTVPELEEEEENVAPAAEAPVLDASPFAPPTPTRGARARLFLLVALVILILVPVIVFGFYWQQGNARSTEAEQLTARAELALLGAQAALDNGDKVTARERLTEAQEDLAQAIELDGSNEQRSQLIATIEAELQEVLQIIPLYGLTDPLITFPPDARPQRILVVNEDIFVIDGGRQALLQYRLDPATGVVADQVGQVLLRQGDQIENVTVGTLADIAWLPLIPGFEDRPSLIITDRNNNVFRYDQRVDGVTVMPLADRASWGSIGQVQTYNGRIYLADEIRGSILRYEPGRFTAAGVPWFSSDVPINLAGLISMEIDGDIWLLFSNGMILRFREGQQMAFSPENSIGLAQEPSDLYVTRQDSDYIYLVDAGEDRILVYDKSGAYIGQLTAPENDLLRGLSALYIDEVGGVMYILTQTGLFSHPVLP